MVSFIAELNYVNKISRREINIKACELSFKLFNYLFVCRSTKHFGLQYSALIKVAGNFALDLISSTSLLRWGRIQRRFSRAVLAVENLESCLALVAPYFYAGVTEVMALDGI